MSRLLKLLPVGCLGTLVLIAGLAVDSVSAAPPGRPEARRVPAPPPPGVDRTSGAFRAPAPPPPPRAYPAPAPPGARLAPPPPPSAPGARLAPPPPPSAPGRAAPPPPPSAPGARLAPPPPPTLRLRPAPAPRPSLRLLPGAGHCPPPIYGIPVPQLGFTSQFWQGGEYVTSVRPWSRAAAIGLERGDMILRVNGVPLTCPSAWNSLMRRASLRGEAVLMIRDVRTGLIQYRRVCLAHH